MSAPALASALVAMASTITPSALASASASATSAAVAVTGTPALIPEALELSAAFAGALAGGLKAVGRELDAVGVAMLAIASGLGGGVIRDVLLQSQGIYALGHPRILIVVLVAALVAFFFSGAAKRIPQVLFVIDAIALGLFAVAGCDKALLAHLAVLPAIMIGVVTSVGGGIVRDLLVHDVPRVLRPGGYYASASIIGTSVYAAMVTWLRIGRPIALITVVPLVVVLRVLSTRKGWRSPHPIDLTPEVAAAERTTVGAIRKALTGEDSHSDAGSHARAHAEQPDDEPPANGEQTS